MNDKELHKLLETNLEINKEIRKILKGFSSPRNTFDKLNELIREQENQLNSLK